MMSIYNEQLVVAAVPLVLGRQFARASRREDGYGPTSRSPISGALTEPCASDLRDNQLNTSGYDAQNPSSRGIVCGTDFSIHATEAADVAAAIAPSFSSSLTLAHIVERPRGDSNSKALAAMLRYRGRNKLKKEAERLRAGGATVHEAFLTGAPATELVKCAIREKARLIVVSSRGLILPTRLLIGSVAEQTAQLSPVPVLVVRDPKPFKSWASGKRSLNVLIAHDFSASADAALEWVAGLRRIGRCRITVAHLSTPHVTTGWLEVDARRGSRKSLVEIRELLKADLTQRSRKHLGKSRFRVEVISVRGSVATRLVRLAKESGADLIVVGTNQKGTIRRLCLGSVSRGVLQQSRMSVGCVPMTGSLRS